MNILVVADFIFDDDKGGSGRVVTELSKGLVKKRHNVYILARKTDRDLPSKEEIEGLRVFRYNVSSVNTMTFVLSSVRNSFRVFNQMLKETKFDIIVFHHPLPAMGVNLSRKTQEIPKVYIFYSLWSKEYETRTGRSGTGSFMRTWVERKALESCKRVIVLSEYSKRQALDIYKGLPQKMEIISGGVDTVKFQPMRDKEALKAKLGISSNIFFLFTLRNLVPRMGLENLIQAIALIVKERQDVVLIIGGMGPLEEKLKGLVKDLGLDHYIKIAGFIEEDKLPLYYQAADLFILPSRCLEGFGLVTLEALSCGTPVLGTPIGGTKEILGRLDKELLFKDTEAKTMAEKILFYSTSKDLLKLSEKCRDFVVSNYSWERVVMEHERVYSELNN